MKSYVDAGGVLELGPLLARTPATRERSITSVAPNSVLDGRACTLPNNHTQTVACYFNANVWERIGTEIQPPVEQSGCA